MEWSTIAEFKSSYAAFTAVFNKFSPQVVYRHDDRITPKLQCLFAEVPQWLSTNKLPFAVVSEQAFESVHKSFVTHISKYSKPKMGEELLSAQRRRKKKNISPSPDFDRGTHTPSRGTRSGQTKKRTTRTAPISHAPSVAPAKRIIGLTQSSANQRLGSQLV